MAIAGWKKFFHSARRFLAKLWLNSNSQVTTIGVTGSFGKTNTVRAIATVLAEKAPTLQTDLNLDTLYNLPITLLKIRPSHRFLVLEMGVDHRGEMETHLKLVKPMIGVVTGIAPVHSDPELLGSLEGIIEEKGKLLESLPKDGWAILNRDDKYVRKMAKKTKAQILWYSLEGESDFWADEIKVDFEGTSFKLHPPKLNGPVTEVKIPLLGKHFVQAALATAAVGSVCGLSPGETVAGLAKLKPLSGRLSIEKGPLGTKILDDHLRANPASTIAGLETLSSLPHRGRKIAVLGEMGELGDFSKDGHREVGRVLVGLEVDFLITIGPLTRFITEEATKKGFPKEKTFRAKDVREAANFLKSYLKEGDLLYLKGSLLRHVERVILILEGEKVCCDLVVCHHYYSCQACPNWGKVG